MKKTIHAAFVAALLATTGAVLIAAPAPVLAQAAAPKVTAAVGTKLNDASKLIDAGKLDEATAKVGEAQAVANLTDYDKYSINKFLGLIAYKKMDDAAAETAYDAMAHSPAMPANEKLSTLKTAAAFAMQNKHDDKVLEYVALGDAAGLKDETLYSAAAQAYFNKNDYRNAAAMLNKSIDASKAAGKQPSHDTLALLSEAQSELKDNVAAEATLDQIAFTYGGADDWAYAISQAIGTQGMTDIYEVHLMRLGIAANAKIVSADMGVFADAAGHSSYWGDAQAAVDHGGKAPATMTAKKVADDKASLPKLDAEAAKAKDGGIYLANAESYYGYGDYAKAEEAARAALAKGGLKDSAEANIVLGQALVAQGHFSDAIPVFDSVKSSNGAAAKVAYLWSGFAQQKLKQVNAAAAAPAAK